MANRKNSSKHIKLNISNSEADKLINGIIKETTIRLGLGEEKYEKYKALAQQGKFNEIPDEEMHKDYYNPTRRLGCHYAENLLNPRNFFRTIYDTSYMFFDGNK